jgi:disulfide bond formation protein DsbB
MARPEAGSSNANPEDVHPQGNIGDTADRPPFFTSWSRVYTAVLAFLALLIILFYVFMKAFS